MEKKNVAIKSLYELYEELDTVFEVEPEIDILESIYKQIETKYRNVKKQQETIADRIVESGLSQEEDVALEIYIIETSKLTDLMREFYPILPNVCCFQYVDLHTAKLLI